jgi:branched-chain amino acid aminotransferase
MVPAIQRLRQQIPARAAGAAFSLVALKPPGRKRLGCNVKHFPHEVRDCIMKIYLDGEYYDKEDAKISVFDHGLLYGDGVFEGIRFYHGKVFRLTEHIDRLYNSAKAICLQVPQGRSALIDAILETIRKNELHDGYVRLVVTRGSGDLGLNPALCLRATVFIIASKITLYPEQMYRDGLHVVTCATRRIPHGALSPMVKSLNYLNNVLAKIEAQQAGAGEGLMLNEQGFVAECTGDNIFTVKDGEIIIQAVSHRDQARNRADALARLVAMVERAAERPKVRRPTRVPKAAKMRRLEHKVRRGDVKAGRARPRGED